MIKEAGRPESVLYVGQRELQTGGGGAVTCLEGREEAGGEAGGKDCLSLVYVTGNASLAPSLPACFTTTHMTAAALFCNSSHEDRVVLQ